MLKPLAVVLLALEVGAGFGSASVELSSTSDNAMEIELRVEVRQSAQTVVAHLSFEANEPITLPLVERESGVFGIRTEVARVNYRVVFEILGPAPVRSDSHSLMELGLVFADNGVSPSTSELAPSSFSNETTGWGWLALGLGTAALSALAFWVLGGGGQEDEDDHDSSKGSSTTEAGEAPAR